MALERKLIKAEDYHEHLLEARFMGPDLLGFVDTVELSGFFIDVEAALAGGRRYVDAQEAEALKQAANIRRK